MRCWIALHTLITTDAVQAAPDVAPAGPAPAMAPGSTHAACPARWALDGVDLQRAMASIALAYTPRVALVDEAVVLDVTGSLRLFGGMAALMKSLVRRMEVFFASNQAVAHIRYAQGATSLIAIGRLRLQRKSAGEGPVPAFTRAADLPLHTLSAARAHIEVLERIGCRCWDDLLKLPRDGVARRFGAGLLEALDRARGAVPDDYPWLALPEQFEEKLELEALVSQGPALMAGVDQLLVRLHAWLLGRQSGLCALKIIWHLDKRRDVAPTGELDIRTAQPAQDLRHVARLIAEHLARQNLPAPVHALTLRSLVTEKLSDSSAATASLLMQASEQGDTAVQLIERLSARLGDANVQAWQPHADHRPEAMQRWTEARSAIKNIATGASKERTRAPKLSETHDAQALPACKPSDLYPSWLLPAPVRLATLGNSPVYQGKLTRMAGPQRLEAAGWLSSQAGKAACDMLEAFRDYYIYRSEQGALLWIYSERLTPASQRPQQRAWYLHGFFG